MSKLELPKDPKFYDYESPITKIAKEITESMMKEEGDLMFTTIKREVGFEVDKDELISALQYDRNQYDKGYKDGAKETFKAELEEIKPEINQYGSIMAEWNDNMTKEEIVESVLKQAKECVLFVLDNHIKEIEE